MRLKLGQRRSTQCKVPQGRDDGVALFADLFALAVEEGRYGYRKISTAVKAAGRLFSATGGSSGPSGARD